MITPHDERHPPRARRDPARLHPRAAQRRGAGHARPGDQLPRRHRPGRRRRPPAAPTGPAGRRCAPAPTTWPATTRSSRRGSARARGCRARCPREQSQQVGLTVAGGRGDRRRGRRASPRRCAPRPATAEVLRHRDVAALEPHEKALLDAMIRSLRPRPPLRRDTRRTPWRRGEIDLHRTLRRTLRADGRAGPRRCTAAAAPQPRRVVLLVDVSASHAPVRRRAAAAVPPDLDRLDPREGGADRGVHARHPADPDHARDAHQPTPSGPWCAPVTRCRTGPAAPGSARRSSAFLDRWGARGMARGAVVVVFSDGWERGDATQLGEQMQRLHRLAHRVVWVNPHRGKEGYEPVQQGIARGAPVLRRVRRRALAAVLRTGAGGDRRCVRCSPS